MSNNPALTAPASEVLDNYLPRQRQRQWGENVPSSATAGVEESKPDDDGQIQPRAVGFSKYDVGWRRIVRHFSPA